MEREKMVRGDVWDTVCMNVGLRLTETQLDEVMQDPRVRAELEIDGSVDTVGREVIGDVLARKIVGRPWPIYGDPKEERDSFFPEFFAKAPILGYRRCEEPKTPADRTIFALDVDSEQKAEHFIDLLSGHVGAFKIGLELFGATGAAFVRKVAEKHAVMLDLKLHDIPQTVENAVRAMGDLGVRFLTLHVQQREAMYRAARAAERSGVTLLGVTVLTSMTISDCCDLGLVGDPPVRVRNLTELAYEEGIRGFVCSAEEVGTLFKQHPEATYVVPGIRPAGAAAGDQRRTGTPAETVSRGATHIVVGRPIRDAADPVAAADSIAEEIDNA